MVVGAVVYEGVIPSWSTNDSTVQDESVRRVRVQEVIFLDTIVRPSEWVVDETVVTRFVVRPDRRTFTKSDNPGPTAVT